MELYSKSGAVSLISSMIVRNRLPHAFIVFGERGVGKRTLCRYIAKQVLCERGAGEACGKCISCKKIEKNIHPDFIEKTPGGKSGNYLSEELRSIVSDALIAPNDGSRKIYFLPNFDKALPEAQNTLLKVLEEPPLHVMFLMTAESKERILPTILSRVISLGINEPTPEECMKALKELKKDEKTAKEAIDVFGGNIGKCLEYIDSGGKLEYLKAVRALTDAIINRDEFMMAAAVSTLDRQSIPDTLSAFKEILADVSSAKLGAPLHSVYKDGALRLSDMLRQSSVERIYDAVTDTERKIAGNAIAVLALSDLCCKIAAEC